MAGENRYEARGDAVFLGRACIAICDTENLPKAKNEANARLIAAAPRILAALQAVADYWAGGDVPAELDAEIRSAIAEATEAA